MLRETAVQKRVRESESEIAAAEQSRAPQRKALGLRHRNATQRTSPQDTATHDVDVDFFICLIRVDAIINLKYGKDTRTHTHTQALTRAHAHTCTCNYAQPQAHAHTHTHTNTQPHTCTYHTDAFA